MGNQQHFLALGEYTALGEGFWQKFGFSALKVLPMRGGEATPWALGIEFVFCSIGKHPIQEGFLPGQRHAHSPGDAGGRAPGWWPSSTAFAVVIGKEVFGGTGMNVLAERGAHRACVCSSPTRPCDDGGDRCG